MCVDIPKREESKATRKVDRHIESRLVGYLVESKLLSTKEVGRKEVDWLKIGR